MKIKKLFIVTSLFVLSMLFFTPKSGANTYTYNICRGTWGAHNQFFEFLINNNNCHPGVSKFQLISTISITSSSNNRIISIKSDFVQVGLNMNNPGTNDNGDCYPDTPSLTDAPTEYAFFGSNSTLIQNNPGNSFYDNFPSFFASTTGIGSPSSQTLASFSILSTINGWKLKGKTITSNGTYYIANVFKCGYDYSSGNQFSPIEPLLLYVPIDIGLLPDPESINLRTK